MRNHSSDKLLKILESRCWYNEKRELLNIPCITIEKSIRIKLRLLAIRDEVGKNAHCVIIASI